MDGAVAAAELSRTTYASTGVEDMTTEIESLARASKRYSRAKLDARWGATQSVVVSESVSWALSTSDTGVQGCTMTSPGTRPGLPAAFSAGTTPCRGTRPSAVPGD